MISKLGTQKFISVSVFSEVHMCVTYTYYGSKREGVLKIIFNIFYYQICTVSKQY